MKYKLMSIMLVVFFLAACGQPATEEPTSIPPTETPAPTATPAEAVAPTPPPPATDQAAAAHVALELSAEMADRFPEAEMTTTDSGLQYWVTDEGAGEMPQTGNVVQVHYNGLLADGSMFDSSYESDQPLTFPLGVGAMIPGWDEGISMMPVGTKAKMIIPADLAFGDRGVPNLIPPGATLYFEVEVVDILPGAPESPTPVDEADYQTTDSGLKYYDFEVGDGPTPEAGQTVVTNYTGWLEDGTKFDSSLDRGQPLPFVLGAGQVIPGWDEGIATMKVGGKRQLVIPPELGYGADGAGGVIPPNATLIFEVELVDIQ